MKSLAPAWQRPIEAASFLSLDRESIEALGELVAPRQQQPSALQDQVIPAQLWVSLVLGLSRALLGTPMAFPDLFTQVVEHDSDQSPLEAGP